jgi:CRP-like cAMP-binding protein
VFGLKTFAAMNPSAPEADSTAAVPMCEALQEAAVLIPSAALRHSLASLLGAGGFTEADFQALQSLSRVREVRFGQTLFARTQTAADLVWLHQGSAALGLFTAEGVLRTERTVVGPGWLDQSSAWLGAGHAMDAQAQSLCVVVSWPVEAIGRVLHSSPELGVGVITALAREVDALTACTHDLIHKDAPARLASWLIQHCEPLAGDVQRAVVQLQGRKRDLASQLAITPETLSRLMRSFSRQGVIAVTGYTVHVSDLMALQLLALA